MKRLMNSPPGQEAEEQEEIGLTLDGPTDSSVPVPVKPRVLTKEAAEALRGQTASQQWKRRAQLMKQAIVAGGNPLLRKLNKDINQQLLEYDRVEPKGTRSTLPAGPPPKQ